MRLQSEKSQLHIGTGIGFYGLILIMGVICPGSLPQAQAHEDKWGFLVATHIFAANIRGEAGTASPFGPVEFPIDLNTGDILDGLNSALVVIIRADKGAWSINSEIGRFDIDHSQSLHISQPVSLETAMDMRMKGYEIELYGGYSLAERLAGLEVLGGIRYMDQDVNIDVTTPFSVTGFSAGESWFDPFVGLRYQRQLNDRWTMNVRGDIGGLGVSSRSSWRFAAGLDYRIAGNWQASIGYKHLDVDFEQDSAGGADFFRWDAKEHGFLVGLGYIF